MPNSRREMVSSSTAPSSNLSRSLGSARGSVNDTFSRNRAKDRERRCGVGGEMREQSRAASAAPSRCSRVRERLRAISTGFAVEKSAVCEPPHTHARTSALDPRQTKKDKERCQMQTRRDESLAHGWPWAPDVTRALVCLMVGLLLVLASVGVPA